MPTEAELSEPGLAFAAATSSFTERMPFDGAITSTLGSKSERDDAGQVAQRVVRQVLVRGRRDRIRRGVCEKRVAVGLGFRHQRRADGAARAGAVLDDDGLPELGREPFRHGARDDVGAAPGVNGTMILIDFAGHACACAPTCRAQSASAAIDLPSFPDILASERVAVRTTRGRTRLLTEARRFSPIAAGRAVRL